ncbi:TPA: LysR family substrate-binding domain-containing protein [Pseudomonas aeruginosa]
MPIDPAIAPLHIAVSTGMLTPELSALLAKQRAEEPETPVRLVETTEEDQEQGLRDGRYCLGLVLSMRDKPDSEHTFPLWQDEVVVVLPSRSPLLAFAEIPLSEVAQYPLVMWSTGFCTSLGKQIVALMDAPVVSLNVVDRVRSFDLMAVLVAAGYGVGFATQTRVACSRDLGIVTRPLAEGPHYATTYLTLPRAPLPPAVDRLVKRAQAVTC